MGQLPDDAPAPRLCNITKNSPTEEYGYNLHAEKKRGQFVGLVDKGSPADIGGLKTGDRIFAVNGHSIIGESHKQVVQRIKEHPTHCEMLVLDHEGCQYYSERNIPVTLSMPNIVRVPQKGSAMNGSVSKGFSSHQNPEPVFVAPPPPHDSHFDNMNKPRATLCKLVKTSPSDEFGFNLHAEKNRGHFIGDVDNGGIGERAGLISNQRIVGVNGQLIYPTTLHKDVIQLIKSSPLSTTLLLASADVDKWYRDHNEVFSFDHSVSGAATQEISPHSIQISSDELHDQKLAQERARYDEPPMIEPSAPEDYPVAVQRTAHVEHATSDVFGTEMDNEDMMNAVFSALPGLDSSSFGHHVITSPELSREERAETQSSLVSHEGHSRAASIQSYDHISLGRESAVDVPKYDPYAFKPAEKQSDYYSASQSNTYKNHHSAAPSADDNDIFHLSAKEARERLRPKKDRRGLNMTLDEKYRLVSNM